MRLDQTLISKAKAHVGKPKIDQHNKLWLAPEFCATIKAQNYLRRKVMENRTGYLEASTDVGKLTEEARHAKWEETDPEHNPVAAHT